MDAPWNAEHEVDAALARRLIEAQFPELAPASVEPFGVGWDNVAYLVSGRTVFRFPRRTIAVPLLENETRVLPALAPLVPVRIPVPTFPGRPGLGYPWPFAGYELLAGRTACRAALDSVARARLAQPLAAFLRALHGVPSALAQAAGPDTLARIDVERRVPDTVARLERVRALGWLPARSLASWPERFIEAALQLHALPERTLVHGDLYARHLLVDEAGDLVGVIDWGDVHCGHPGLDLSLAYSLLPDDARHAFFASYGPVAEHVHVFARFRSLFSLVTLAVYGESTGDDALVREGRAGLDLLASAVGASRG